MNEHGRKLLRDLAERATPGPWVEGTDDTSWIGAIDTAAGCENIATTTSSDQDAEADAASAAFIAAANLAAILSLLAALDAAENDANMQEREAGNMEHNARVLMAERDAARAALAAAEAQVEHFGSTADARAVCITMLERERDAARAEAQALRGALEKVKEAHTIEINPANYDHDQVCELNFAAIVMWQIADAALAAAQEKPDA